MKKMLYVLTFVFSMVCASCTPESKLLVDIAVSAQECPIVVDEYTTCVDIFAEGKNVVYKNVVDENRFYVELSEIVDAETLRNLKENNKDAIKTAARTDKDFKDFIKMCKDSRYNIIYRYIGSRSDYQFDIIINFYEL